MNIKRYAVFACQQYYPSGGWNDFRESFDSQEEAEQFYRDQKEDRDWATGHVVDLQTGHMKYFYGE